jgi:hypothetical protein
VLRAARVDPVVPVLKDGTRRVANDLRDEQGHLAWCARGTSHRWWSPKALTAEDAEA